MADLFGRKFARLVRDTLGLQEDASVPAVIKTIKQLKKRLREEATDNQELKSQVHYWRTQSERDQRLLVECEQARKRETEQYKRRLKECHEK